MPMEATDLVDEMLSQRDATLVDAIAAVQWATPTESTDRWDLEDDAND